MSTAPREARSLGASPSARDQLTVFNDREGVVASPLGGEQEDEKDERLPGAGKGGMVQVAFGNVSLLVLLLVGFPPVIIRPAIRKAV